jgi:hypothetical protein
VSGATGPVAPLTTSIHRVRPEHGLPAPCSRRRRTPSPKRRGAGVRARRLRWDCGDARREWHAVGAADARIVRVRPAADRAAAEPEPGRGRRPAQAVLLAAVQQRVAAGTRLTGHSEGEYPKGTQHGPLTFYHVFSTPVPHDGACSGGEDYFTAAATTAEGSRQGNVRAMVTRLGSVNGPATECAKPPEDTTGSCERKAGPHGEVVVESTFRLPTGRRSTARTSPSPTAPASWWRRRTSPEARSRTASPG